MRTSQPEIVPDAAAQLESLGDTDLRILLRERADWLRREEELLEELGLRAGPANVVEFGPIALSRISEAHQRESGERRRLEAVARANYAAQAQTHAAVIDLLEAADLADLAGRIDELAKVRFGLAAGVIAMEGSAPTGWIALAEGQVDQLLGPMRLARLGHAPVASGLFGAIAPQIGSAALLRLGIWRPLRQVVVAFGAYDGAAFSQDMGAELVTFVARIVERMAERWPAP